jgi:DNA end-binding protein Ku
MLYMLRYEDELRDPKSALSGVKEPCVDADELSLAKQLINGSTSKFDLSAYKNDYAATVKKLVDAKRKGKLLPEPEPAPDFISSLCSEYPGRFSDRDHQGHRVSR